MTSIYFIRHADYVDRKPGGAGPRADHGLSDAGLAQARLLRDRLVGSGEIRAQALYASPLPRASQTADILAGAWGLPALRDPDLEEWRSGNDLLEAPAFDAAWAGLTDRQRQHHRFLPGHETASEFDARVRSALQRILARHAGQTVVVVAHGGVVEVAFCHFLALADGPFRRAYPAVANTSITCWRQDRRTQDWILEFANDTHHLRAADRAPPQIVR